ncbi:MAG: hypothetical protein WDN76_01785 [Alphaproteobacteria bacterium]
MLDYAAGDTRPNPSHSAYKARLLGGLSLPLPALLLTYLPSIVCGVHAIRTGRNTMWLWLFIIGLASGR